MSRLLPLLSLCTALLCTTAALAAGEATIDEAKAMAINAADFLRTNGPDKAFPEFTSKTGSWHDRDLYVFVQNDAGIMLAHGNNSGLIGKDVSRIKDPSGNSISDNVRAIKDTGWINFVWQNPVTKAIEPKTAYILRVGEYLVGVGAYVK